MGVSKNNGTPKWMVKINGKPYEQMDDLGIPLFLETTICLACFFAYQKNKSPKFFLVLGVQFVTFIYFTIQVALSIWFYSWYPP